MLDIIPLLRYLAELLIVSWNAPELYVQRYMAQVLYGRDAKISYPAPLRTNLYLISVI